MLALTVAGYQGMINLKTYNNVIITVCIDIQLMLWTSLKFNLTGVKCIMYMFVLILIKIVNNL